ncbi:hypothetical protein K438DRAFT_1776470 [Mycena galopus ATCC 62051]|nr:hypothetical protein K438DRAFT_1776470 [Mycena galopus ATCC 62051]
MERRRGLCLLCLFFLPSCCGRKATAGHPKPMGYSSAPCQWLPPPKEAMIDAYMKFTAGQRGSLEKAAPPVAPELVENKYSVMVVDVFTGGDTYTVDVPMLSTDVYIFFCLVGQGFMPCSPWKLKLAIAACVRMCGLTNLQCPALGIQAWMKALSDLQGAAFKPYRAQQFTTCFDLYLGILEDVDKRVKKALQRDSKDWQLKNFCPVCTYKLEGEGQLYFSMLATCDGNNYLKRVLRKNKGFTEDGVPLRGGCKRPDPREASAGGDYFISRPDVDRWVKEQLAEEVVLLLYPFGGRHGQKWRARDSAKYPLAIENALMDAFGKDIGFGYDIGCGHAKTLKNSPLGPKAKEHNFRMLVGAFHGHAHNRRCQLKYLATYVEGMGIEDLEGCTFLVNNYEQAVSILDTEKTVKNAMAQAGVTEEMMKIRLEEEKAYLDGLSVEPEQETDQMEYYQQLVNLQDRREKLKDVMAEGSTANGTVRRHARENLDRAVETAGNGTSIVHRDFDLLCSPDTTSSICAWATPAARQLLDSYHKLQWAREEIPRLNIEIRRFVAYMKDERAFLVNRDSEIRAEDPVLALLVRKYRNRRGRNKLGAAFTGTLQPGIWCQIVNNKGQCHRRYLKQQMDIDEPTGGEEDVGSQGGWLLDDGSSDEDEGRDAEGEELSAVLEGVASLGVDR